MTLHAGEVEDTEAVSILLVDDRPENLIALEAILACPEYRLVKASSGSEALKQLLKQEFAVLLFDVMMPEMDGYELASLVREREATRHTPIIFLTAVAKNADHVSRGYAVGAADYLTKPLVTEIVRAKVAVFVELYRKTRQVLAQQRLLRESEKRQKEYELASVRRESERRLKELVGTVPGVVWEMTQTTDGQKLTFVSRYVEKMLGYPATEWLDEPDFWFTVIHGDDRERVRLEIAEALASGQQQGTLQFRWMRRCGTILWTESRYVLTRDRAGQICGLRGVSLDITDRLKSIEELKNAKELAESANQMKTVFLATMSHEIRTPLGAILGFTEMIKDPAATSEEREKYLEIISRNGESLSYLINDILDLSKVESDHMEIERIEFDIEKVVVEVINTLRSRADAKGVGLDLKFSKRVPENFVSDPSRFRQILMNLVDNAIKFTEVGGVEISVDYEDDLLSVDVADSGIGISDEQRKKLFQPFMQADGSTTRRFGGTGLGLVLSKKLASLLGGDVQIKECRLGQGCTFRITARNFPATVATARAEERDRTVAKTTSKTTSLKKVRVLLVEDAPDNQNLISRMLTKVGAEVDIANNGEEGVAKAKDRKYDIVLMDIQMPVLDGFGATAELRKRGFDVPIIALTAHALVEDRRKCLNVGCTDHLAKPVKKNELIEIVRKYTKAVQPRVMECAEVRA